MSKPFGREAKYATLLLTVSIFSQLEIHRQCKLNYKNLIFLVNVLKLIKIFKYNFNKKGRQTHVYSR